MTIEIAQHFDNQISQTRQTRQHKAKTYKFVSSQSKMSSGNDGSPAGNGTRQGGWLAGWLGAWVVGRAFILSAAQLMAHDLPVTFACLLRCCLKLKLHYGPELATYWVQIWLAFALDRFGLLMGMMLLHC